MAALTNSDSTNRLLWIRSECSRRKAKMPPQSTKSIVIVWCETKRWRRLGEVKFLEISKPRFILKPIEISIIINHDLCWYRSARELTIWGFLQGTPPYQQRLFRLIRVACQIGQTFGTFTFGVLNSFYCKYSGAGFQSCNRNPPRTPWRAPELI